MKVTQKVYLHADIPFMGNEVLWRVTASEGMEKHGLGPMVATATVTFDVPCAPTVASLKLTEANRQYAKAEQELRAQEARLLEASKKAQL